LEEFRSLAINQAKVQKPGDGRQARQVTPQTPSNGGLGDRSNLTLGMGQGITVVGAEDGSTGEGFMMDVPLILDDWQLADWLDLDSSVSSWRKDLISV
jgi:hypothetical protein